MTKYMVQPYSISNFNGICLSLKYPEHIFIRCIITHAKRKIGIEMINHFLCRCAFINTYYTYFHHLVAINYLKRCIGGELRQTIAVVRASA